MCVRDRNVHLKWTHLWTGDTNRGQVDARVVQTWGFLVKVKEGAVYSIIVYWEARYLMAQDRIDK